MHPPTTLKAAAHPFHKLEYVFLHGEYYMHFQTRLSQEMELAVLSLPSGGFLSEI